MCFMENRSAVQLGEYWILFVEKAFRLTAWEHVTHIAVRMPDGGSWRMTYHDAIRRVKEGTACFYVIREGRRIELELAHSTLGYECLRATIDNEPIDILLSLPDYRDSDDRARSD